MSLRWRVRGKVRRTTVRPIDRRYSAARLPFQAGCVAARVCGSCRVRRPLRLARRLRTTRSQARRSLCAVAPLPRAQRRAWRRPGGGINCGAGRTWPLTAPQWRRELGRLARRGAGSGATSPLLPRRSRQSRCAPVVAHAALGPLLADPLHQVSAACGTSGRVLVVCDGSVYDVSSVAAGHPGGAQARCWLRCCGEAA
jgi:hypothetical protein